MGKGGKPPFLKTFAKFKSRRASQDSSDSLASLAPKKAVPSDTAVACEDLSQRILQTAQIIRERWAIAKKASNCVGSKKISAAQVTIKETETVDDDDHGEEEEDDSLTLKETKFLYDLEVFKSRKSCSSSLSVTAETEENVKFTATVQEPDSESKVTVGSIKSEEEKVIASSSSESSIEPVIDTSNASPDPVPKKSLTLNGPKAGEGKKTRNARPTNVKTVKRVKTDSSSSSSNVVIESSVLPNPERKQPLKQDSSPDSKPIKDFSLTKKAAFSANEGAKVGGIKKCFQKHTLSIRKEESLSEELASGEDIDFSSSSKPMGRVKESGAILGLGKSTRYNEEVSYLLESLKSSNSNRTRRLW